MKPYNDELVQRAAAMAQALLVNELICEKKLACRWDMSTKTLQKARREGTLIPFIKLGRVVRYSMADIVAYESRQQRASTSEAGEAR